jgi:hypothetical protein
MFSKKYFGTHPKYKVLMMSNKQQLVHTGIVFPSETLKKLDERKGRYISRNKYLLMLVEEHLGLDSTKNLQSSRLETPASSAEKPTTPTITGTPAADKFERNGNHSRGSRRYLAGDADANDKLQRL